MLSPAFETQYAVMKRCVSAAAIELMLTMLPPPAAFMAFASALIQRKTPVRLVSSVRWKSAIDAFSTVPIEPMPAAFTARLNGPKRSTVSWTAASTE